MPAPVSTDTRRVLVVDDDASVTRLVSLFLRDEGFEVLTAGNGEEALREIEQTEPDVIVLDLQMPVMDGETFYRELRARGAEIPVLVLSAYGARAASRRLGAQDSLDKPFDPDTLVTRVERLLDHQS
jgi:DNA-binding response OmpR family regulator